MILDKVENVLLYADMHPSIVRALEYLRKTDFAKLPNGKYELAGTDLFSIVNDYITKDLEDCRLEAHRKYIDIHYMAGGSEIIGFSLFNDQEPATEYDEANDFILYCGEKNYIKIEEKMFAIFFPSDLHMPGLIVEKPARVKKVVVKVRVPEINFSQV